MILKKKIVVKKEGGGSKYVTVANELTKLMDLDPPIDTTQDEKVLKELLVEAGGMLDPSDKISDLAAEVLGKLGVDLPSTEEEAPKKKIVPKRAAKPEPEEEPEEPEPEEEEEPEEPEAEGDELDDLDRSGLKKFITENEMDITVYKSMSDDDIRAKIRELASPEEEEAPAPKKKALARGGEKKEPREKKATRLDAFVKAMKKGGTREDILNRVVEIYGGTLQECYRIPEWISVLLAFGAAEKDEKGRIKLV